MATTKQTRTKKAKPEEVIAYPGKRPVKNSAPAKGGSKRPSDVMTGGGKMKSAAVESEPTLKSKRIGNSPSKRKAAASLPREGSLRKGSGTQRAADSMQGAARGNKEGMAKSAKRKSPTVATATDTAGSRKRPTAQPDRAAAKTGGKRVTSAAVSKSATARTTGTKTAPSSSKNIAKGAPAKAGKASKTATGKAKVAASSKKAVGKKADAGKKTGGTNKAAAPRGGKSVTAGAGRHR